MSIDPARRQTPSPRLFETGDLPPILRDAPRVPRQRKRINPLSFGLKATAFIIAIVVLVVPLVPDFRNAVEQILDVEPALLVTGLGLQVTSWYTYSLLTKAALGEASGPISRWRMFRIQMSTKALSNIVPGGSAAGSALGYRLLTLSGVRGADAGFALATAGLGSAVVLNLIFWLALMISIPIRGINGLYAAAALGGVVVMLIAVTLVVGLAHGQGVAERVIRWVAGKFRLNGDTAVRAVRQVGQRVEELLDDRDLLKRVVMWAAVNWVLDALSLWVFLRAYGASLQPDALFVAFGFANVLAAIPITPGGLGYVESAYISLLVWFGLRSQDASLGVASYRLTQMFLPILVGGFLYATLRFGPFRIKRRERLTRLTQLAHADSDGGETKIDFLLRAWPKRVARRMPEPRHVPLVVEIPETGVSHDVDADDESARAEAILQIEGDTSLLADDRPPDGEAADERDAEDAPTDERDADEAADDES